MKNGNESFLFIQNLNNYLCYQITNPHVLADINSSTSCTPLVRINKETFESAYHLYWEKVYTVCYHSIRETEAAKGMVQEIFKSLWERRAELELEKVENYLIRAAKLKAFEFIRNKVSRQKHIEVKMQDFPMSTNCTEEHVLFNNLREKVSLLVDTLPCQCKKVYKMSREQGLANKEIASALFITERAVEYHITRATTMLKLKLTGYSV